MSGSCRTIFWKSINVLTWAFLVFVVVLGTSIHAEDEKSEHELDTDISIIKINPPKEKTGKDNVESHKSNDQLPAEEVILEVNESLLKEGKIKRALKEITLARIIASLKNKMAQTIENYHQSYVGDPYALEPGTEEKIENSVEQFHRTMARTLADPNFLKAYQISQFGPGYNSRGEPLTDEEMAEVRNSAGQRLQEFFNQDVAKFYSEQQLADLVMYQLSSGRYFPKDKETYDRWKMMAIKIGALPVGAIVLASKVNGNRLNGKVAIPVFKLPSGMLGLAFYARIANGGIALSPQINLGSDLILMRFKMRVEVGEQRKKGFKPFQRSFETTLSEDWSNLIWKKIGLDGAFYYQYRWLKNLETGDHNQIHEVGLNLTSQGGISPFQEFLKVHNLDQNLLSFTNFNLRLSLDSDLFLKGHLELTKNFKSMSLTYQGQGLLDLKSMNLILTNRLLAEKSTGNGFKLGAGIHSEIVKDGSRLNSFLTISEPTHDAAIQLNLGLGLGNQATNKNSSFDNGFSRGQLGNGTTAPQLVLGIGISGSLENVKDISERHLANVDGLMIRNLELYFKFAKQFDQALENLAKGERYGDPLQLEQWQKDFNYSALPLLVTFQNMATQINNEIEEYQATAEAYERKYRKPAYKGMWQEESVQMQIARFKQHAESINSKTVEDWRVHALMLALASYFQAP